MKKITFFLLNTFFLISIVFSYTSWANASVPLANDVINQQIVVDAVNEYRRSKGLKPLTVNVIINKEAVLHSRNMANKLIPFGHQNFTKRIALIYTQIQHCQSGSENVAYFPPSKSAKEVVRLWLTSPGHRKNIEGHFNLTGVGIARDQRGWTYYTQIFIRNNA